MKDLISITREQLETERIDGLDKTKVYCNYEEQCRRSGEFQRCYLDIFIYCPFAVTYYAQQKERMK